MSGIKVKESFEFLLVDTNWGCDGVGLIVFVFVFED